jgi:hypothetical protein
MKIFVAVCVLLVLTIFTCLSLAIAGLTELKATADRKRKVGYSPKE